MWFGKEDTGGGAGASNGVHAAPAAGSPVAVCPPSPVEDPVERFCQGSSDDDNDRVLICLGFRLALPALFLSPLTTPQPEFYL